MAKVTEDGPFASDRGVYKANAMRCSFVVWLLAELALSVQISLHHCMLPVDMVRSECVVPSYARQLLQMADFLNARAC